MDENFTLNTGAKMPAIGFGTWQLEGKQAKAAVIRAIKCGYRLIDTAKIYGNEKNVGEAVRDSNAALGELFITTKLWPTDFGRARAALEDSLKALNLEYVDLYLIHWPSDNSRARLQAWLTLTRLAEEGLARAVGVSNFQVEHLTELLEASNYPPAVNQIEFHPFIYKKQAPILKFCHQQGIAVEAYSPLAQARWLENKETGTIARKYKKSPAHVLLRWAIQHGTVPIPRSSNPGRIKDNTKVFDFKLTDSEMRMLDSLSSHGISVI